LDLSFPSRRIAKSLFENGVTHPDSMSHLIIIGYHYYLNGIEKTIEELKNE
jgi:hypothetical protein